MYTERGCRGPSHEPQRGRGRSAFWGSLCFTDCRQRRGRVVQWGARGYFLIVYTE